MDSGLLAVALDDGLLFAQLARHVARAGARDLDPRLGEQRARGQHEDDVEQEVEGVRHLHAAVA